MTREQLRGWIGEGRLRVDGDVRRSDMNYWAAAGTFQELQPFFQTTASQPLATAAPIAATAPAAASPLLWAHVKSGASWFYWVAGLSLVSSIASFAGQAIHFIFGLGVTHLIEALADQPNGPAPAIILGINCLVAGVFILFGIFSSKGHLWAFIIGTIAFLLDALVFLIVQDWIRVGFHAFVLFFLIRGANAAWQLRKASQPH